MRMKAAAAKGAKCGQEAGNQRKIPDLSTPETKEDGREAGERCGLSDQLENDEKHRSLNLGNLKQSPERVSQSQMNTQKHYWVQNSRLKSIQEAKYDDLPCRVAELQLLGALWITEGKAALCKDIYTVHPSAAEARIYNQESRCLHTEVNQFPKEILEKSGSLAYKEG